MDHLNDANRSHLVIGENSKCVAKLFRRRLILRYIDLRQV